MTLLFMKHLVEQIIRGEKIVTRQPFRPMVKEGGSYHLKVEFFGLSPTRSSSSTSTSKSWGK